MSSRNTNIFKKYSQGKASVKEEKVVNVFFDRLQEASGSDSINLSDETGDLLLMRIEAGLNQKYRKSYFKIAASVAAILVLGGLIFTYIVAPADPTMRVVAAQLGEQQKIVLPDSSIVYLNSGSSIIYPEHFGKESRNITLVGEAYFEVVHKDKHPFIINSDNFKTQVLGTKFVVKNYKVGTPSVTVVSGKVKVTDIQSSASQIITKNQRVEYSNQTASLLKSENIEALNYIAWREGRVYFEHENIAQVLQTLHRMYNVTLQVQSPLYKCNTISGNFSGDNIEKVLSSIRFINDMQYTIKNKDTINIVLKPCNN